MARTIIITGATRGLGLALAKTLIKQDDIELVLAVRDLEKGQRLAQVLGARASAARLDMASMSSITAFAENWDRPIFGLINNAGLQNVGPVRFSGDGIEISLAVNHLGPLRLTLDLLPWLEGGKVLGIGSGTHNPEDKAATRFGFRGGRFTSIQALARGEVDASTNKQAGFDRYATSKLLAMATSVELARRFPKTQFLCLDPGLMPGTGLARTAPRLVQLVWNTVLPLAVPFMSGASTPAKSASAGAALLLDRVPTENGEIYDHHARRADDVWDKVLDPKFGGEIMDQSLSFLAD